MQWMAVWKKDVIGIFKIVFLIGNNSKRYISRRSIKNFYGCFFIRNFEEKISDRHIRFSILVI